ncbi:MAG TPA: hypothetical protein VFX65_05660 [Candidatus Limnocylindrales bacterium]|nr:hypothetical protein [Candidatus Limnocylindrales bacterium]
MRKRILPILVIGVVITAVIGLIVASMKLELGCSVRERFSKRGAADEIALPEPTTGA